MQNRLNWSVCFILVLLGALLVSCARDIIIDLPAEKSKLVAVCHFEKGERFKVKVSTSQPVYNSQEPFIPEQVDISISENGAFLDKLFLKIANNEPYWESRDTPQLGKQYSMVVRVQGYPNLEASGALPQFKPIEQFALNASDLDTIVFDDGRSELRIPLELRLVNALGDDRYFGFKLSHEIEVVDISVDPPEFQESYISDSTFFLADGRTLSLLHNTAENIVLVNENFWNEDRRTLNLTARIPIDINDRSKKVLNIAVEWRTLSKEFYKYHLSLSRQGISVPLSDPDAVFNNINGGYGNFSGYITKTYVIDLTQ